MESNITLPENTIKNLQTYVAAKINERKFSDESLLERLLLLTEEVGELVKSCRKIAGMHVDKNKEYSHNVGEEITDVINMVFAVGIELKLDIEEEYRKKEKIVDARDYGRHKK